VFVVDARDIELHGEPVHLEVLVLGQNLVGDDSNQNARLTPYFLANIRASYQISDTIQLFGRITNLFDRRYASYGTYFDTDGVGQPITDNLTDPRTITLGQPRSFFGGVKLAF